jgi:Tetratricopeptide repeat
MYELRRHVYGQPVVPRPAPIARLTMVALLAVIAVSLFGRDARAQDNDLATAQRITRQIEQLEAADDYLAAILLAEQALAIYERVLGAESLDTDAARGRLAVLYVLAGEFERAEAFLRRVPRGDRRGLLSGRGFLVPGDHEPTGYGLYSYLLFNAPPRDQAERARYLKALEAHLLLLPPMAELERHKRLSQLNLTLVPVRQLSSEIDKLEVDEAAAKVLSAYDYARARVLLDDLGIDATQSGPYLLSRMPGVVGETSLRLFFDMSHVEPKLVWDWTRKFSWFAAQERSWSEVALHTLQLNIRNVIAKGAGTTVDVVVALQQWVRMVVSK